MERINKDIYIKIWSYVGSRTLMIMPSNEREAINDLMNSFKTNPVVLTYRLIKWKRIVTNKPVRATMKTYKKKNYLLKGGYPINSENNNNIEIFGSTKDNIIPRTKIISSLIPGRDYRLIWKIYKLCVDDMKRAKLYSIFWNNY